MVSTANPVVILAVVTLLASILCAVCAFFVPGGLRRAILLGAALVLLVPSAAVAHAAFPWVFDARYRAYKALYEDIEVGMTRSEVLGTVENHYPAGGKRLRPKVLENTSDRMGFFMNPEGPCEPNCEGIFLEMQDDRVVSMKYSPD